MILLERAEVVGPNYKFIDTNKVIELLNVDYDYYDPKPEGYCYAISNNFVDTRLYEDEIENKRKD